MNNDDNWWHISNFNQFYTNRYYTFQPVDIEYEIALNSNDNVENLELAIDMLRSIGVNCK